MPTQKVAEMTVEELKALIAQEVEQRLQLRHGVRLWPRPYDPRTPEEVLESLERNMWTPPPGSPSAVEMLREDRDR